jgi:hypothetical protein
MHRVEMALLIGTNWLFVGLECLLQNASCEWKVAGNNLQLPQFQS